MEPPCSCALCSIEERLLIDLTFTEKCFPLEITCVGFPLLPALAFKNVACRASSDELLRKLFGARAIDPLFVETLLVLVFLPMLRRMARAGLVRPARKDSG